jgi:hypothetical protein
VDFFSSILKIFNSTLTLGIDGLVYYYYIILPDSLVNLRYPQETFDKYSSMGILLLLLLLRRRLCLKIQCKLYFLNFLFKINLYIYI